MYIAVSEALNRIVAVQVSGTTMTEREQMLEHKKLIIDN